MKYNSIGEQLIAKAQELDPNYKPDKFNDMSEAIDVILNNSGGDIWLDISPYLIEGEETMSISQEGYDLIYNSFSIETENPINKYTGILVMGNKLIFNGLIDSDDKQGFNFIFNITIGGDKGYMDMYIYNDKSIEMKEGKEKMAVVEGTLNEQKSTGNTKYYTIPETQTSPFIFHSSDIGYFFVDVNVLKNLYTGISPTPDGQWSLIYGNETSIIVSSYTPASLYPINVKGNFPRNETSSVDVTFPTMDRITNSMCLVTDMDASMVFLKSSRNIWGSFQTPIIYDNDGKYRCWYMDPKEGASANNLATIKCKVVNLDSGDINIPQLPADASTSTYVLKAVNGTVQWVKES